MTLGTTLYIGPVQAAARNLEPAWTSAPDANGFRGASIKAVLLIDQAEQLSELIANSGLRVTIGGPAGVLDAVWFDGAISRDFNGWYLLQALSFEPYGTGNWVSHVPVTISALHLGQRQPIVTRSDRARANDYSITPQALLAQPYWGDDEDGQRFVVTPGGSFFTREYDPTSPHDVARIESDGRQLGLYSAAVGALGLVAVPDLTDGALPTWVTDRGGEVRGYCRRCEREVYGPSHHFPATTDMVLTNGIIRAWVGGRGLPPYLNVQAFADGEWREVGCVQFGASARELVAARFTRITPDASTLVLTTKTYGDIIVTLKRGERMFRCSVPSTAVAPAWKGTPPASRANAAANGTGTFGNGLDGGGDDAHWEDDVALWSDPRFRWDGSRVQPDLRLLRRQSAAAWSEVFSYHADKSVTDNTDGAGFLSLYDEDGLRIAECLLDTDGRIKFRMGATTVQSAVQTFAAGDDLLIGMRFSTTEGMTLSVRNQAGVVAHVNNAAAVDPITSGRIAAHEYLQNSTDWGDGSWGDGVWGGVTLYADGVIDSHMGIEDRITDAEFATLAAANGPLEGLPSPESRLVWYGPFDATPLPTFTTEANGRVVDAETDTAGLTKALAYLDAGHTDVAALLATAGSLDGLVDHHAQFSAESEQKVRVR